MSDASPTGAMPAPDSAIAEQLGVRSARMGTRALAFLIDVLLWLTLVSPLAVGLWLGLENGLTLWPTVLIGAGALLSGAFCLVQLLLHGRRGVTVGKAAMRLRSVSLPGLSRPGFWRIVLRALVLSLSQILPVAGPILVFCSSYWDASGRNRSLIDRVGRVWLIDLRAGIDPSDANALHRARRNYEAQFRDISEHLPVLSTQGVGARLALDSERSAASVIGAARERWITEGREQTGSAGRPLEAGGAVEAAARHGILAPSGSRWVLVFDDASTVPVAESGLLGRSPQQFEGRRAAQLVAIDDPRRMLSKTHLAFGADGDGVWVEDLGSSNGTAVQQAGEQDARRIAAGVPLRLAEGATVQIGGRAFRIHREDARA